MRYVSTRGAAPPIGAVEAMLAGLAPDGGLYVPERLPRFDAGALGRSQTLAETAALILAPFFVGEKLDGAVESVAADAFNFPAPMIGTREPTTHVLELFHGPTAAFKDYGARFLAGALTRVGIGDFTVLVATSGDTGAAVAAAFHRKPGARVMILYPDDRVSPRQAHQLGCFGDNVAAFRVAGEFDDCQRMVKQALSDQDLRARKQFVSANSISLGRLLPQMAYYTHAAAAWARTHEQKLNFVVPTGNLGNAFACMLARACGAPIGDIVFALNANRTLADYLASGRYQAAPSVATLANAMDVGDPSNVERLSWLHQDSEARRRAVSADSVNDAEIGAAIEAGETRYGRVWCPHTACAVVTLERMRAAGERRDWCVVATAHPAKFETIVEPRVGHVVELPPGLKEMLERPASAEPLAVDYAAFREQLLG